MLSVEQLRAGYPDGQQEVLRGVDTRVEAGQMLAVIGPNGSGKTTLLRCIAGLLRPRAGRVLIDGKNRFSMKAREFANAVSFMIDEMISTGMSVMDYLLLSRTLLRKDAARPNREDLERARAALKTLDLEDAASKPLETLSAGQLQRARVARVLAQEPRLALLDEPTAHLDPKHGFVVMRALKNMCGNGACCVVVMHDLQLARFYADRVLLLSGGQVFHQGPAEKALSKENIKQVFGVDAEVDPDGWIRILPEL